MAEEKIGIIGIGLMGHGIATNIQKAGWEIGFLDHPGNQPIDNLTDKGARVYQTINELSKASDIVIICVTGSPQVEAVMTGDDGLLNSLRPGMVVIDCSTAIPASTLKLAKQVEEAGARFMDAPMTRTPIEAAQGRLNLIVGGNKALFEEYLPLLRAFAENITYAGGVSSGHTMKLLHNFVSLGFSGVLAEATACSRKAGIDQKTLHAVLAAGGGAGVVLDRFTPFILEGDETSFQFSLANSYKDIDYYKEMTSELGAANGIAEGLHSVLKSQIDAGKGDKFVPQLIDLLLEK